MQVKNLRLSDVCHIQKGKRAVAVEAGTVKAYGAGSKPTKLTDKVNVTAPCIRATATATIGDIYLHTEDFWAEGACLVLTPKEGLVMAYLYHWLKKNQPVIATLKRGATIPSLDMEQFEGLPFELPPMDYQLAVCELLDAMSREIADLRKQKALNEQRYHHVKENMLDL